MANPYTTPQPPTASAADTRKLYKRKRVWIGGMTVFALGIMWGTQSGKDAAAANPAPKVTVTATTTATETSAPEPAPTVTETQKVKVKVTVTARANTGSGTSGGSTTTGGSDDSSSVYYANCTEARAVGAAPIHRGEPGYASRLDRDGDGIGCDS
jgi:hypothetical protein